MTRTDDPVRDSLRYQSDLDDWEARLPKCDLCGEPVDTFLFNVDGDFLCEDCMISALRISVDDLMEERYG